MKSNPLFLYLSCIVSVIFFLPANATRFALGNGIFPQTFNSPVGAKTFSRATGTFIVGLTGSTSGKFAISTVERDFTTVQLTVNGIAQKPPTTSASVGFLALAAAESDPDPIIAGAGPYGTATTVFALFSDGTAAIGSPTLLDASGAISIQGSPTRGIVGLAATEGFIFALVRPSTGLFGSPNGGVAVVRVDLNLLLSPITFSALVQTAAQAGDSAIKAKKLDTTTPEVFSSQPNNGFIGEPPTLFWDDPLQRLYIGLVVTSGNAPGDIANSVVVARISETGVMTFSRIANPTALVPTSSADQQTIVTGETSDGSTFNLTAVNLRVMHTSTGPSYLIVNGGNESPTEVSNKFLALPLVDLTEPDGDVDPANNAVHGTLAKKDSALVNGKFVVPATAPGDLVNDPTLDPTGDDSFALVGGTLPPLLEASMMITLTISDMVVVDDTVYISINFPQSDTNETGILYSQAKFGPDGKIIGWTPWSKRGFPPDGLPNQMNPGTVLFFDVDAVTGDVWAVGDDNDQTIAVTDWDRGRDATSLPAMLNQTFPKGCNSVLDLDAFTRFFDRNTPQRYALFGGLNSVAFARISRSRVANASNAPQFVIDEFLNEPENFLVTNLPEPGGTVSVLEYSRTSSFTPNEGYFFAGTENGLYVYVQGGGSGFTVNQLSTLDLPPFGGTWFKVSSITGAIVDIKTLGNVLYVLTFSTSPSQPLQNTLYSIPFNTTAAAMFAAPDIIAQTNVGVFQGIIQFTGIQLIGINDDSSREQLILATNKGLFNSTTPGGVQTAPDQATAGWVPVSTDSAFYRGIAGMDPSLVVDAHFITGFPSTVWPISVRDQTTLKTFDRGSIQQLNGAQEGPDFVLGFEPTQFNGNIQSPNFTTLLPITSFFSDGARRFFIVRPTQVCPSVNNIMVSPFNAFEWDVSNPAQNVLFDPALTTVQSFNWVKQIGVSGIVLAGTNSGVVALE